MVEDPSQVVHSAMDALAESGVDGIIAFIHEDFEMHTPPGLAAEPDTYLGPEGVRRWFDSFLEVMDRVDLDAFDLTETGPNQVVGTIRITARGGSTGIETAQDTPLLCTVRDGKIIGMSFFTSRRAALAAAESQRQPE